MVKQLKHIICTNLSRIRAARRYSQREVAAVLSIKQPSYRNMEVGITYISAIHLALLADFYRIPIQDFYQSEMELDAGISSSKEQTERLKEQLQNSKVLLGVYEKRIEELEAKVRRKDTKIESLLARSTL
ncbi:helix-turn-helix domain-containing protein [Parapedobacter koreensis]|uniref:Helix-turn-helix n=1 Tax=Parapedobacter koreensis TaxID=332977 RepID=A0A1H7INE5_9SPHI|nr:helix-turn-helix transcriptional regulator [Parapedobacter koreensis]SEK63938.1 Helix-turn-helix [Parapedobacter koreensis]